MVIYDEVKATFVKEGCVLLTTQDEMIAGNYKSKSKYRIVASCGHEVQNCWYHMFKYRGTGKICKECADAKQVIYGIKRNENLVDCNAYALSLEHMSIELIKKYAGVECDISLSPECCLADLAIKNKSVVEDKWLPIQVKATLKGRHDVYSFGMSNNYPNMWIVLVCIEDEKFWILEGNRVIDQCKISIGMKKYGKYAVDKNSLSLKFKEIYSNEQTLRSLESIQEPITDKCKTEQMFRKLRESVLLSIPFEAPRMNQSVYDLKVNGFKIQEKTARVVKTRQNSLIVTFAKRKGQYKQQAYNIKDNDYYWVNLPDKIHFYIFPADILADQKIISSDEFKGSKHLRLSKNTEWINGYKYSYNDENLNMKIATLFELVG
jgi:hypothetical protein